MDIGVQSGRGQLIVFLFCSNLVAIAERKVPSGYWKIKKTHQSNFNEIGERSGDVVPIL